MNRYKHILLLFFMTASIGIQAQDDYVLDKDSIQVKDKLHYNFTMGAGFGYSSNAGDFFSTYYSPSITYDVSSKFSLQVGMTYNNGVINNYPMLTRYGYQVMNGNIDQYYTYVSGTYQVNERLKIGGSIYYDFSQYTNPYGERFNNADGLSRIGYSGFFEYKVTDGMRLQGEIRVNDRSPYRNSFMGGPQYSVFGQ